ncbi:MAG: hypothetical protein H6Q17_2689 [Bacteroidetes bacterium]|jgi:hypothetical protein|nr:hypothetical protein [Bacteroidota bacterium]
MEKNLTIIINNIHQGFHLFKKENSYLVKCLQKYNLQLGKVKSIMVNYL